MAIIYIFSVRVKFGLFSEKETRRLQNLNGFCWQHEMKYLWNFSKLDVFRDTFHNTVAGYPCYLWNNYIVPKKWMALKE